jgi:hypothetical protein
MAENPTNPLFVPDGNAQDGSLIEAQNALLKMMEPEKETPETEEAQPTEEEESTEETQDESLEEETEEDVESEEETEPEESDEEGEEEPVYAVTVNGEEQQVSLDELTKGYSRQSDYTRKTQELASERNNMAQLQQQWAAEISQAQAERQQYVNALGQIVQQSMVGLEQFNDVDWDTLKEEDPIAWVTKNQELKDAQERIRTYQRQQYSAEQQNQQEMAKMRAMAAQEEHKKLVQVLPEWSDNEARGKLATDLWAYAETQGFTENELNEVIDHRQFLVLMKAKKYDDLQKADVKSKKVKNKPKLVRAGKGTNKKQTASSNRNAKMKRLRQTGHVDDAATLLEDMFKS